MLFNYKLTDNKGKITSGTIEGMSIQEAKNILAAQEGTIIMLEPVRGHDDSKKIKKKGGIVLGKVKMLEKVMFAKHLAIMIKAGMAIDTALETLRDNASSVMSKRLSVVLEDVRKGNRLSDALRKYPRDFDLLFVNMVAVGEQGGTLAKNLNLLASQQRKSYELKSKIKSASVYPSLVIIAIIGLVVVISIFVLPKILTFFKTLKIDLPPTTKAFIAMSDFMVDYWMWIVGVIVLVLAIIRIMAKFKDSRLFLHFIILKLPIVGGISKNLNLALFARTLGSLLDSGITIDRALQIVAQTLTNDVYKREATLVYHKILKGGSLAEAMNNRNYFPSLLANMVKVGESSGNLSEVLDYLADFYELEVDNTTKNLSTMLEPALLIMIGLVVGFVAISIINPIYELTSNVGR
ncbi:type II secretion system F family protein [Candidatus Parcubacteria bacterium]|nr:MAG: type II secretion system F family protein [Candidatus Parcubacteria bacterium]